MFVSCGRRNGKSMLFTRELIEQLKELKNGRLYISQRTYDYLNKEWIEDLKRKNVEIVIVDKKEDKSMVKTTFELIKELENKMSELTREIAELKKGQNAGDWKPKEGEDYWFMGFNGEPDFTNFSLMSAYDDWKVNNIPVFKTEEECQKYCDYRKALIEKSYKFSREEWEDENIDKYFIFYGCRTEQWIVDFSPNKHALGLRYFKTFDDAQYMIDNYSDEMLKWGLL